MTYSMKTRSPKKIFISRTLEQDSPFHQLCTLGHEVIAQSLVDIQYLDFNLSQEHDAVFFYSQKAISHFFSSVPYDKTMEYGVMGLGSLKVFQKETGRQPQIVGTGDNQVLGRAMNTKWKNKTILFPQAKQSLKSLHELLPTCSLLDLIVYDNKPLKNIQLPACDIYLFTSPMNAKVFFKNHQLGSADVYAIGATTATQIKAARGKTVLYCKEPSIENLCLLTKTKL